MVRVFFLIREAPRPISSGLVALERVQVELYIEQERTREADDIHEKNNSRRR